MNSVGREWSPAFGLRDRESAGGHYQQGKCLIGALCNQLSWNTQTPGTWQFFGRSICVASGTIPITVDCHFVRCADIQGN